MIGTGSITLALSILTAVVLVWLNGWFGAGDLWAFFVWSLPFAGLTALAGRAISGLLQPRHPLLQYLIFALAGYASALLWSPVVWAVTNPWFGTFSFPVLLCWLVGGVCGLMFSAQAANSKLRGINIMWLGNCFFFALVPFAMFAALGWVRSEQKISVTFLQWERGPQLLAADTSYPIPDSDLDFLRSLGITGTVRNVDSGTYGRGSRKARVVLVAYKPVDEPIELRQPDGLEIFYIQGENGWTMYPADASTLDRKIRLWPDDDHPNNPVPGTRFSIENSDGSRQGGTAFSWSQAE